MVFDSKQTQQKHFSVLQECSAAHGAVMYNILYKSFKHGSGGKKLNSSWQQHYI